LDAVCDPRGDVAFDPLYDVMSGSGDTDGDDSHDESTDSAPSNCSHHVVGGQSDGDGNNRASDTISGDSSSASSYTGSSSSSAATSSPTSANGSSIDGSAHSEGAAPAAPLGRFAALATCAVVGGTISYYRDGRFEAKCRRHGCRMTRTSREHRTVAGGQGRPCGLLAAWLRFGEECEAMVAATDHRNPFVLMAFDYAERRSARAAMRECVGGETVLAFERPQRDGEGSEPERVP
jgi:hypothetical protein